jgi:hypothetical protein
MFLEIHQINPTFVIFEFKDKNISMKSINPDDFKVIDKLNWPNCQPILMFNASDEKKKIS